ncbi:peptidyl-tRNA hydrolase [Massarina eburnea CBS 473.64]|uniref:peptidyl-tRNA hydrolase n=1 Tax=Massarina eburnea CBS 473.64 TaxID=1395130 RepID=A0A6A6RUS7_9PLEO|nr:peptidyl-tRNA hydrolase [Massarina eburnea CBS 473.64]
MTMQANATPRAHVQALAPIPSAADPDPCSEDVEPRDDSGDEEKATIPPTIPSTMPPPTLHPLLICSLGNPGTSYATTLHSAGHLITSHISTTKAYTPFTQGLSGLVSRPNNTSYTFGLLSGFKKTRTDTAPEEDDWTFWQSVSLMNISGPGVKKAWSAFCSEKRSAGSEPRLVVVHDELEAALGKVSIKDGANSARGHNGLKSVQTSLGSGAKWWRIGVGIGRPESRDASVVSRYVLRKMDAREERALVGCCSGVVAALREIGEGRRK